MGNALPFGDACRPSIVPSCCVADTVCADVDSPCVAKSTAAGLKVAANEGDLTDVIASAAVKYGVDMDGQRSSRLFDWAQDEYLKQGSAKDAELLDELLEPLVTIVDQIATLYGRIQTRLQEEDANVIKRTEEVMHRVQRRCARVHRLKTRKTWQVGEIEQSWSGMYPQRPRRFKNLQGIIRKVSVENLIVRHWRSQACHVLHNPEKEGYETFDVGAWDSMDVFQVEERCGHPLISSFMNIWKSRSLGMIFRTPAKKVEEFIGAVEAGYEQNPYHNRIHAADVTLAAYYLWAGVTSHVECQDIFREIDLMVLLLAAAVHDVAHPGVSNDYLIKTRGTLALRYNDQSVLENFSSATGFQMMNDLGVNLLDHNFPSPPVAALRSRVISMVLATDMAFHSKVMEDLQSELNSNSYVQNIDKLVFEKSVLHMADLVHPLRPHDQHQEWTRRVTEEFFAQGDREKECGMQPMVIFDREKAPSLAKNQVGFIKFVVAPLWATFGEVLVAKAAAEPSLCLQQNLASWEQQAAEEDEKATSA
mmetsp:Transcript_90189/g.254414  ORF Transcript_90189/g.254414 Transcript_90189/m.254414 type:complete len:534 (-) Transcript_90189:202-1803(-)